MARSQIVPAFKPKRLPSPILFVGEAPSSEEVIQGEPLVGPSGRVFNAILRTAGLERADYYITNVYDEQAPENNVSEWRADKERTEKAFARLTAEVEEAGANVIVPLGATALWAFTGQNSITPYRGTVSQASRIKPGAKLVPTFHPSHVIQQWKYFSTVTADIIKAAAEARKGPKIVYPRVSLNIQPTLAELEVWKAKLLSADLLSTDIETGWGQITCIGFAPNDHEAICIPFVDFGKPHRSYWANPEEEAQAIKIIGEILASPVPKLFQNGPYDVMWLAKKWHMTVNNYLHDTRLEHHALYPELPKDLAFMGATYTDLGAWKNWGGRYSSANKRDE
jgi:uracil-DNA glycosylase family 4